jgi:hypothetical protein
MQSSSVSVVLTAVPVVPKPVGGTRYQPAAGSEKARYVNHMGLHLPALVLSCMSSAYPCAFRASHRPQGGGKTTAAGPWSS